MTMTKPKKKTPRREAPKPWLRRLEDLTLKKGATK
jgi:hypothetical protein